MLGNCLSLEVDSHLQQIIVHNSLLDVRDMPYENLCLRFHTEEMEKVIDGAL